MTTMTQQRFVGVVLSISRRGTATIRRQDDKLFMLHAEDASRAGLALNAGDKIEFSLRDDGLVTFAVEPALSTAEDAE
jgi:hypothetical protein